MHTRMQRRCALAQRCSIRDGSPARLWRTVRVGVHALDAPALSSSCVQNFPPFCPFIYHDISAEIPPWNR